MHRKVLTRVFNETASDTDIESVYQWLSENNENKATFAKEKELWLLTTYREEVPSEEGLNAIYQKIENSSPIKEHTSRSSSYKTSFWISSAAAVILLFALLWVNNARENDKALFEKKLASAQIMNLPPTEQNDTIIMSSPKGVKSSFELPDGSRVTLNSDSKLLFPKEFTGETRNVHLIGEAQFDIVKNEHYPLFVTTDKNFSVEVLGTNFSVKSYPNDNYSTTTLYSGLVKMHYRNTEVELVPDQSCVISDNTNIIKIINEKKPQEKVAWTRGELIFDNTPMPEVIKMIERWHGTTFIVKNPHALNYHITARFGEESIVQIMDDIGYLISINYKIDKNIVTIF